MGLDKDGNVVIIEIKKGISTREVISQILEYGVWSQDIKYEELNTIAKEKHLSGYPDLYEKYEHDFKSKPDPFNQSQRWYIVAEKIDEKIEEASRYLRKRNIDIKCVELNFYENNGKKLVETKLVVGTEETIDQELGDESATTKLTWEDKLELATSDTRKLVTDLITKIEEKFDCKGEPHKRWYYISTKLPYERKNLFAVLLCGKEIARIAFRIDPNSFDFGEEEIKSIKGWFFPLGCERRIIITKDNTDLIFRCLDHAYDETKKTA